MFGPKLEVVIGADLTELNRQLTRAQTRLETAGRKMMKAGVTIGAVFGVIAAASEAAFARVEHSTAQIATLMDDVSKGTIPRMRREIVALGVEFGQTFESMAKARYDIVSAGFREAADSAHILRVANELAMAGAADVGNTAKLVVQALRAYNLEVSDARSVSDLFFQTVKLGLTTVPELAQALGSIFSTARAAGVSLVELQSAVSVMTVITGNTNESVNALNRLLFAMSAPTQGAAQALREAGIEVKNFRTGEVLPLIDVIKQFRGMNLGMIKELIGGRLNAAKALAIMSQNTGLFSDALDEMADSAGTTRRAAALMADQTYHKFNQLKETFNALRVAIGEAIDPSMRNLIDGLKKALTVVTKFVDEHRQFVEVIVMSGIKLGSFLIVAGGLSRILSKLFGLLQVLTASPFGLIILGIATAFVAVDAAVKKAKQSFSSYLSTLNQFKATEQQAKALLEEYERLKNITNRTKEENELLHEVIQDLAEIFPSATTEVDRYGRALDISTDAVKKHLEQERALLRVQEKRVLTPQLRRTRRALGGIVGAVGNLQLQASTLSNLRQGLGPSGRELFEGEDSALMIERAEGAMERAREKLNEFREELQAELLPVLHNFYDLGAMSVGEMTQQLGLSTEQAIQLYQAIREVNSELSDLTLHGRTGGAGGLPVAPNMWQQPGVMSRRLWTNEELANAPGRGPTAELVEPQKRLIRQTQELEQYSLSLSDAYNIVTNATVQAAASQEDIRLAYMMTAEAGATMFQKLASIAYQAGNDIVGAFANTVSTVLDLIKMIQARETWDKIIPGIGGVIGALGILFGGGSRHRYASGGHVHAPGVGHKTLALLTRGEYVVNPDRMSGNMGTGSTLNVNISPNISVSGEGTGEQAERISSLVALESEKQFIRVFRDLKRRGEI